MTHSDILIIGSGFGGLGAAIRLKQRGYHDFVILEKAGDVGGTWRENTYPGCACDVPSHLYSFSFALNPLWSDTYSGQAEIWSYLRACAERYGVTPQVRLHHRVEDASWDPETQQWQVETSQGLYTARVLISATGALHEPSLPDLPGLSSFTGTVFHSAQWRHDHDLTGRRVAVIGTGASAIQFVPQIQPQVEQLTVLQRTPPWIMPRMSRPITRFEHAVYRHLPGAQRAMRWLVYWARESTVAGFLHPRINRVGQRIAKRHMYRQVSDPQLRRRVTPTYVMGCKRVLISNDYLPALQKPNVDLVTDGIREIAPDGVVTTDGTLHRADTIIFGTGFHVTDLPVVHHIRGADGRTLGEVWDPTMVAFNGTTVPGFPNLFFLLGPNTGLGHTSVVLMIESQINHVLKVLDHMRRKGITAIEPTPEARDRFTALVDRRMAGTVWNTGGCKSWYLDASGRNSTLWPGLATGFRLRLRRFRHTDYRSVTVTAPVGAPR